MCVWQSEDDLAEKLRSNDMLQRAINTYREAAELPDVTSDLLRASLKRRAERQQFLGDTNTDNMLLANSVSSLSDMHFIYKTPYFLDTTVLHHPFMFMLWTDILLLFSVVAQL